MEGAEKRLDLMSNYHKKIRFDSGKVKVKNNYIKSLNNS